MPSISHSAFRLSHSHRGSVLLAVLWIIIVLVALVLVLGFEMRSAAQAQANTQAEAQASAAERGAEQMLLSLVDQKMQDQEDMAAGTTTTDSTADISLEARPIGECYVWVITPMYDDGQTANPEQQYTYGLTDEMGKLDLNIGRDTDITPTSALSMFESLPGMTPEMAGSILAWEGATDPTGQGATDAYYATLPEPYQTKKAAFETPDELALVAGFTPDVLYGGDTNHNGVVDQDELQSGGAMGLGGAPGAAAMPGMTGLGGTSGVIGATAASPRGIMPFVTVLPADALTGTNPDTSTSGDASTQIANINNENQLRSVIGNVLGAARAGQIVDNAFGGNRGGGGNRRQAWTSVFQFYYASAMTPDEFQQVYPRLTVQAAGAQGASAAPTPKVNIMTAPREVLACLPGLVGNDSLVTSVLTQRAAQLQAGTDPTNLAWLVNIQELKNALQNNDLGVFITGESTVFSGDIVAVAPNARAFKRVRVVIDGTQTPARIIYRRDLTQYGWPLPDEIRQQMKSGEQPGGQAGFGLRGTL